LLEASSLYSEAAALLGRGNFNTSIDVADNALMFSRREFIFEQNRFAASK
jgi:hypothetical protein